MSWEQTVLRRIKDQFSKDEAIAELLKRLSESQIKTGVFMSEATEYRVRYESQVKTNQSLIRKNKEQENRINNLLKQIENICSTRRKSK